MKRALAHTVIGAIILLVGPGCGSATAPPPTSTAADKGASGTPAAPAPAVPAEAGTVINVTIAKGLVEPTNAEVTAIAGTPIVLQVNSDASDSIHVHSVPEYVFGVQARPGQRFEFTVEVPGQVDVELHDLNKTIVTITVRPR